MLPLVLNGRRPDWADGGNFARFAGEACYPSLWNGLHFAAAPYFGVDTEDRVHNYASTIPGFTQNAPAYAFEREIGGWAIKCLAASNQSVRFNSIRGQHWEGPNTTVVCGRTDSTGNDGTIRLSKSKTNGATFTCMHFDLTDAKFRNTRAGATTFEAQEQNTMIPTLGRFHVMAIVCHGNSNASTTNAWMDGEGPVLMTDAGGNGVQDVQDENIEPIYLNENGDGTNTDATYAWALAWNRVLSPGELRLLTSSFAPRLFEPAVVQTPYQVLPQEAAASAILPQMYHHRHHNRAA